jgi:hypothetical protein
MRTDHVCRTDLDYPTTADPSSPGVNRGPCATTSGTPTTIEKSQVSDKVIYSDIFWGDIGWTYIGTSVLSNGTPFRTSRDPACTWAKVRRGARRELAEHAVHRVRAPVVADAAQEECSDGRGLCQLRREGVVRVQQHRERASWILNFRRNAAAWEVHWRMGA